MMTCETPRLFLPNETTLGLRNFTAVFVVNIEFAGNEQNPKQNVSRKMFVVTLPTIDRHYWPPYDASKREPVTLQVRAFHTDQLGCMPPKIIPDVLGRLPERSSHHSWWGSIQYIRAL
jgi:hypothetical protein